MVFDKQTAPKELIKLSSLPLLFDGCFPTILLSGDSFFNLLLSGPVTQSISTHLSLTRLPFGCSTPLPLRYQSQRCMFFSVCHLHTSLSVRSSSPFLSSVTPIIPQIPLVGPTISGIPLIQSEECLFLFLPAEKKSRGWRYQREYWAPNCRHYFHIRRCIIHKTNNTRRGKVPRKPYLSQSKDKWICANALVTHGWRPASITDAMWVKRSLKHVLWASNNGNK